MLLDYRKFSEKNNSEKYESNLKVSLKEHTWLSLKKLKFYGLLG